MSNPYPGNGPHSTSIHESASSRPGSYRRQSYATAAAGVAQSSHQRGTNTDNTGNPRTSTYDPSIHSSRNMEIDNGAYGGRRSGTSGATSANWVSDSLRYAAATSDEQQPALQPFFTPSYLRQSRHVQHLRQVYDDHQAELQERAHRKPSIANVNPSLSASSSSANLSKLPPAHIHRGVSQDIIERPPTTSSTTPGGVWEEERLHPLPSRWNEEDKMLGLDVMADGTEVRFSGVAKTSDEAASVRSNHPMPKECGLYYFEITILSRGKDGLVGIGFSSRKANTNRLPGWESESWAYHGDDGFVFACAPSGKVYGPQFAAQDVIGCGVNFRTGEAFFTKNGNNLGVAFNGIKGDNLYPSVGMKKNGEHLRANFGQTPFVFDIDGMMDRERMGIFGEIGKADVALLHPPDDENALIQSLISQYLAHEGYVETAKAFARDVHDRTQSLTTDPRPFTPSNEDDDIHAINRQRIRKSILDGDIDRALKYTTSCYPRVLEDQRNRDVDFRLRCRKFIEMMRRYAELSAAGSSSPMLTKSVESLSTSESHSIEGQNDTQMELDDQLHRETSRDSFQTASSTGDDIDMDASQELVPKISLMKANELLDAAVRYGQELREQFGNDPRPAIKKQLTDIFAIMAYSSPSGSPIGHLFDPTGRAQIAEEVNGAILVSLGKPSSAALEKLCAQTEALLDETASKTGGAASFINVRKDFLQDS